MILVFVIIAALAVVVIALVAVGRLAGSLAAQPPTSVYDLAEAVVYVADRLPPEITAELTYSDVERLLRWHLEYLQDLGVARPQGEDRLASGPLVAGENEGLAFVIGRAADAGMEIDDLWVLAVLDAEQAYLGAIGAIGSPLAVPEDPFDG